jgi:IS30 family transposase
VEHHSRYLVLFGLPDGLTAERKRPALTAAVLRLPQPLRRPLTWDHGREMVRTPPHRRVWNAGRFLVHRPLTG